MKSLVIRSLFILFIGIFAASCGLSKIDQKIHFGAIESFEMKGMTGVKVTNEVVNESRYDITMSEGVIELYVDGVASGKLTQIGEVVSSAKSSEKIETLWRISDMNFMSALKMSGRLSNGEYEGMRVNFSAKFKTRGVSKRISLQDIALTDFITIFAE